MRKASWVGVAGRTWRVPEHAGQSSNSSELQADGGRRVVACGHGVGAGTVTSRSLRGHGIGLNWSKPGQVTMNLSVAWRGTGAGLMDGGDRNPRVYWSIRKAF